MKNIIYPFATICLLLPATLMAQEPERSEKKVNRKVEVTIENGEKTVVVESEENGSVIKEIYKGEAADTYLKNQSSFYGNEDQKMRIQIDIDSLKNSNNFQFNMNDFNFSQFFSDSILNNFQFTWNEEMEEEMKKLMDELKNMSFGLNSFQLNDSVFNFNNGDQKMKIMIMGDDEIDDATKEELKKMGIDFDAEQKEGKKVSSKVVIARMVLIEDMEPEKRTKVLEDVYVGFYPNPGNGDFTLEFTIEEDKNEAIISIYDLTGKIVFTETVKGKGQYKKQITLTEPSGIYILKIQQGKRALTKKLIIN